MDVMYILNNFINELEYGKGKMIFLQNIRQVSKRQFVVAVK